jgi:uncharacterized phage protein (predicted DNA packaging)
MSITLDDLKAHLNVTISDDDDLLTGKLATAKAYVAGFLAEGIDVDGDDTPASVNEAVLKLAGWLYETREAADQSVPSDFLDLLGDSRAWAF